MTRAYDENRISGIVEGFRQVIRGDKKPFTHSNKREAKRLFKQIMKDLEAGRG